VEGLRERLYKTGSLVVEFIQRGGKKEMGEREMIEYDGKRAQAILYKSALKMVMDNRLREEMGVRGPRQLYTLTYEDLHDQLPLILTYEGNRAMNINFEFVLRQGNMVEIDFPGWKKHRFAFEEELKQSEENQDKAKMTEAEAVEFVNWLGRKAGVIS